MAQIKETYKTKCLKLHGEIRKIEEASYTFKNKNEEEKEVKYICLKIDDDDEERIELIDKCSDNLAHYRKGMVGTFTLRLDVEKKFAVGAYDATMLVLGFEED